MRWAVGSGSAEGGLTATILAAVWPPFFCVFTRFSMRLQMA